MIYNGAIELIGKTPILKLKNMIDKNSADVYVKLEKFNPGGSVKDRAALGMIEKAEREGILKNEGSKGMKGAIEKANELVKEKGYFMPQQFENIANPEKHYETTADEIFEDINDLDVFVAGVGTGGTISGVGRRLKERIKEIEVIAVEPSNSQVIGGKKPGAHKIQGIGAGFIPQNYKAEYVDKVVPVSDEDAIKTAIRFAREEGILVGISSGAAIFVALEIAKKLGKGKKVLALSPDGGEKYISMGIYE